MSEQRHAALGIHGAPEDGAHHHHPHRGPVLKRAKLIGLGALVLLVAGAGATLAMRAVNARALAEAVAEHAKTYVLTAQPTPAGKGEALTLPATLQGIIESPIYARSSGYVLRWAKDIGGQVRKGEVLAEIDTPEVDQQLVQAVAARAQAAASLDLAKSSAERWEALRKKDAVTQQELNERSSAYTQAQANLAAADANVKRLQKLEEFKKVLAPFDGVLTHRNVEVGDLIDAGNGGAGRALFTLAQVNQLRAYIYVPQAYAQRIKVGDKAQVTQSEAPDQVFEGTVARTAGAIDAATRTLQVEISVPNKDNALLAGAYVQVGLAVSGSSNALIVPSNVLLFRPEGTRVPVVDAGGHVKLRAVTVGHDLGNSLEILSGLTVDDKMVLNPPDSLADNDVVTLAAPTAVGGATRKAAP
jgi:RND family efflux transporter MFP subunit